MKFFFIFFFLFFSSRKFARIENSGRAGLAMTLVFGFDLVIRVARVNVSDRDRENVCLLGLGEELFDLRQLDFIIDRHLADADFLRVLDVGRQFRRMRKDNPLPLHPVLHHLGNFLLLETYFH